MCPYISSLMWLILWCWKRVNCVKLLIMKFYHPVRCFSVFGLNVILSILFSDTLNLCSSLRMEDLRFYTDTNYR
jgi:hypothetical protein